MTNTQLGRTEFITGILAEELQDGLPTVRVSKALAKEILAGNADSVEIRVTKDFATATIDAVESAFTRVLVEKQENVGFGNLGKFKVDVTEERAYANPQELQKAKEEGKDPSEVARDIIKPEHLSAKFALSKGLKDALASTTII